MECLSVLVQKKQWKTSFSNTILLRLGIFFVLYLAYLSFGTLIFWALEGTSEDNGAVRLYKIREAILMKNPGIKKDLDEFAEALKQANGITNYIIYNETYESNWSIGKSLFFVGTLLTTIGYGQVTPQTVGGKVFTIIFATVGIPMTLILLSAFVEHLLAVVMSVLIWLDTRLFRVFGPLLIRLIHLGIVLTIMVAVFLFLPAIIISHIEPQWNLLDSFYYCFTSLTTIGLGDLIPGDSINQSHRDLYKIIVTAYLYTGVTFMMLTMAIIYDIPEIRISSLFSNIFENTGKTTGDNNASGSTKTGPRDASPSQMNRDKVMETARLSRTTLGLGLRYGLDGGIVSNSVKPSEKISSAPVLKSTEVS